MDNASPYELTAIAPAMPRLPRPLPSKYLHYDDFSAERVSDVYQWSGGPPPVVTRLVDRCLRVMPVRVSPTDRVVVRRCWWKPWCEYSWLRVRQGCVSAGVASVR
jgi:hypothetical protein